MATPDQFGSDIFQPGGRLRVDLLNDAAAAALADAMRLARDTRWDSVRSPHIFMGLLSQPDRSVRNWGERLRADLSQWLEQFRELFHQEDGDPDPTLVLNREFLSDNVITLLREAHNRAQDHGRPRVTPMDLLISLLSAPNSIVAECFERVDIRVLKLVELAVIAEQQAERG